MSPQSRWSMYASMTSFSPYCSTTLHPTAALCGFFSALPQGGELFGPRMDCVAQIAFQRCRTEIAGPRSPPSRPRCAESLGSSDSVQNTNPRCTGYICALYFLAPFSQSKGSILCSTRKKLSRRGRIPSAVHDLMQFVLCKVVFVHFTSSSPSFAPKISPLLKP